MSSLFENHIKDNTLKDYLEMLYFKFATKDFIARDPIQFVYRFSEPEDREIAGFIASTLAQGKRENIIAKVNEVLSIMRDTPKDFLKNTSEEDIIEKFKNFNYFAYRVISGEDVSYVLISLKKILQKYQTLKNLFSECYQKNRHSKNIKETLNCFGGIFWSWSKKLKSETKSLLPVPNAGSACKRINMFLRWMVRKDNVDTGLWHDIIPASKLIIPLDTHVARISREIGLTKRSSNDWITAEEITERLLEFDPVDPIKYDLAIFGYGVESNHK